MENNEFINDVIDGLAEELELLLKTVISRTRQLHIKDDSLTNDEIYELCKVSHIDFENIMNLNYSDFIEFKNNRF